MAKSRGIVQPDVDFDHTQDSLPDGGLHEVVQRLPRPVPRCRRPKEFPSAFSGPDRRRASQPSAAAACEAGHAALLGQTETLNALPPLLLSSLGRAVAVTPTISAARAKARRRSELISCRDGNLSARSGEYAQSRAFGDRASSAVTSWRPQAPRLAPTASRVHDGRGPFQNGLPENRKFSMPAMARAWIWASGTPACRKCSGVSEPGLRWKHADAAARAVQGMDERDLDKAGHEHRDGSSAGTAF